MNDNTTYEQRWLSKSAENPYSPGNSKLLDVGWFSIYPEVDRFIDHIVEHYTPQYASTKPSKKGFSDNPARKSLRVLMLNLYLNWDLDPVLFTAMHFDANQYKVHSRYNALHISYQIVGVAETLEAVGLIDIFPGYRKGDEGRMTRVRPTKMLQDIFALSEIKKPMVSLPVNSEVIILYKGKKKELAEYVQTSRTRRMREEVTSYNDMMRRHHVGIFNKEEDWTFVEGEDPKTGKVYQSKVSTGQEAKHLVRIFNGDFFTGGRTYRHWPSQIMAHERPFVSIDGWYSVEVDFSALHPVLLYAERGMDVEADPYAWPDDLPGWDRACSKVALNAAINADNIESAIAGVTKNIRHKLHKRFTFDEVRYGLETVIEANEPIRSSIASGAGVMLQAFDAEIMWMALTSMVKDNIPAVPIHDSAIVRVVDEDRLWAELEASYMTVSGHDLYKLDADWKKNILDRGDRTLAADFGMMVYNDPRATDGYRNRLNHFMEQNVKDGHPDYRLEQGWTNILS